MSPRGHLTEKNAYAYIIAALKDLGWNVKNPNRHPEGKVYTDNQALGHPELKKGLAARGRSTFSELRRYAPVAAAMATLAPTFWAERPESVRTGP